MRKTVMALVLMAGVSLVSACGWYSAPVVPPQGWLYTQIEAPIDTDTEGTTVGMRSGESKTNSYLGLVALGDASVSAAAADGGLSTVEHVDYRYMNILLGLYTEFTTVAYGQ